MGKLRSNKIINLNNEKKKRSKNTRQSKDIYSFYPVDVIIFENLPTYESVLNFYFFKAHLKIKKDEILCDIAKKLKNIWMDFCKENNVDIIVVSERSIKKELNKIISEWTKIQKGVNKNDELKEKEFIDKIKTILPCCKASQKSYFEPFIIDDLPKSKYSVHFHYLTID